jgi:hypothetical protein
MKIAKDKTDDIRICQTPQSQETSNRLSGLQIFMDESYLDSPKSVAH